ncbi:FliM/FliN family flagellar motor switch protein [Halopseudomonas phragmitis]|uniref:Flagellar motor switch protein FliN n=2 Tax=Pseudomonadaceae TaxID=135621 RepID=A0A1V0B1I9_9GAMM|nr:MULTISPECIES: FliM/FliN family flagellar motor switch protein [Pseudomonadaceae]AQZ93761.1 flagellar motor switch protein FliN [Halopseudomonas phragmitis]RHW20090.1 flagellar motor switch protein FliN [Pseudomonas jilinensis]
MNEQLSDQELDNLINDGDLQLDDEPVAASLSEASPRLPQQDLSFFGKIPVQVTLEVASVQLPLKDLMDVDASSVIALDKLAGEPLDVKVNGAQFAKAEVVVVNGSYGLRILELSGTGLKDLTA